MKKSKRTLKYYIVHTETFFFLVWPQQFIFDLNVDGKDTKLTVLSYLYLSYNINISPNIWQ